MAYTILWQDKGVIIQMSGHVFYSDIQEANSRLFGNAKFDNATFQLWDFSEILSFDLQEKPPLILSTLDKQAMQWNPKMKIAIISTNDTLSQFANEYGEQLSETSWQYRHFKNKENAIKWTSSSD